MKLSLGGLILLILIVILATIGIVDTYNTKNDPVYETCNINTVYHIKLNNDPFTNNTDFKIAIIDSCEYLYADAGRNAQTIFHKGNCKFCKERNTK